MRHSKSLSTFIIFLILTAIAATPARLSPNPQEGQNLLANPSFETPFEPHLYGDGGGFVAQGWYPWWYNDEGDEYDGPEFKQATLAIDPARVRSGENAQQYFRAYARHLAGLYQRVQVPENSRVRFTIYGHAWSSFCKSREDGGGLDCGDNHDSHYGDGVNPIPMRIGIDPTGGTDPYSGNIAWSPARSVYDYFEQFAVEATAEGEYVTVFTASEPEWAAPVINVYWDDAELIVIGGGEEQPQEDVSDSGDGGSTEASSSETSGSNAPQEPQADGSIVHTVQAGDTLGDISWIYDVDVQTLRDLNNISGNLIFPGQQLLVQPAPGSETQTQESDTEPEPPEEDAEGEDETDSGADSADEGTSGGESEVTPPPEPEEGGRICGRIYEDVNQDSIFSEDEQALSAGMIVLSGTVNNSYTTTGEREHYCFEDLPPGDYILSVEPPPGYQASTLDRLPVTLTGVGYVQLDFPMTGAVAETDNPEENQENTNTEDNSNPGVVIAIVGGVLLVGGGLVGAYFLLIRKQPIGS